MNDLASGSEWLKVGVGVGEVLDPISNYNNNSNCDFQLVVN